MCYFPHFVQASFTCYVRISFQNIVENVRNSAFQVSSFWKNDAIFLIRTDLCAEFSALFGDIDIFMKLKVYNGLKPGKGAWGMLSTSIFLQCFSPKLFIHSFKGRLVTQRCYFVWKAVHRRIISTNRYFNSVRNHSK